MIVTGSRFAMSPAVRFHAREAMLVAASALDEPLVLLVLDDDVASKRRALNQERGGTGPTYWRFQSCVHSRKEDSRRSSERRRDCVTYRDRKPDFIPVEE